MTITIAHHALQAGNRGILKIFLALDLPAGLPVRRACRRPSTTHAYTELNLQLGTGVYGSTFFMLTGFHGLHVTIGAIMLTVIWLRVMKGHFTPTQHFAFEGGGLVLALRRRGVAGAVHLRLLAVGEGRPQAVGGRL